MSEIREWIETVASAATALGVVVATWQIALSKSQSTTAFEDSLAQEYRSLCQRLPIQAMLGENLDDSTLENVLPEFLHYFTLTNDQIFMRRKGRVRISTWNDWADGIYENMQKPAFSAAWNRVSNRNTSSFTDLRQFLANGKDNDPASW